MRRCAGRLINNPNTQVPAGGEYAPGTLNYRTKHTLNTPGRRMGLSWSASRGRMRRREWEEAAGGGGDAGRSLSACGTATPPRQTHCRCSWRDNTILLSWRWIDMTSSSSLTTQWSLSLSLSLFLFLFLSDVCVCVCVCVLDKRGMWARLGGTGRDGWARVHTCGWGTAQVAGQLSPVPTGPSPTLQHLIPQNMHRIQTSGLDLPGDEGWRRPRKDYADGRPGRHHRHHRRPQATSWRRKVCR